VCNCPLARRLNVRQRRRPLTHEQDATVVVTQP